MTQEELDNKKKDKLRRDAFKKAVSNLNDADKQRLATYLAYVAVVVLSILSASLNLIFDLNNFDWKKYIISVCFNIFIGIITIVVSLKDGRLSNETRRKGELFDTKVEFKQTASQIVDDGAFRQWNDDLYETQKLDYIKGELANIDIDTLDYLKVSENELKTLKKEPIEYNGMPLDTISKYQYEIIMMFRTGNFTFRKIPYTFFKSATGRNDYKYYADIEGKDKKIEMWSYVYRIIMIIVLPLIIGLSTIDPNSATPKQIAFDMISRITNFTTSLFLGYSLAHDEAKRMIQSLNYKIDTIRQFLDDLTTGIFTPKSRDEIINEKLAVIREKRKPSVEIEVEMTEEQYKEYRKEIENA